MILFLWCTFKSVKTSKLPNKRVYHYGPPVIHLTFQQQSNRTIKLSFQILVQKLLIQTKYSSREALPLTSKLIMRLVVFHTLRSIFALSTNNMFPQTQHPINMAINKKYPPPPPLTIIPLWDSTIVGYRYVPHSHWQKCPRILLGKGC